MDIDVIDILDIVATRVWTQARHMPALDAAVCCATRRGCIRLGRDGRYREHNGDGPVINEKLRTSGTSVDALQQIAGDQSMVSEHNVMAGEGI